LSLLDKISIENKGAILSNIWIITAISYLFRSIFPPIEYLTILGTTILTIVAILNIVKKGNIKQVTQFFKFSVLFIMLGLFVGLGLLLSEQFYAHPLKDFAKFMYITYLFLLFYLNKKKVNWIRFFRLWVWVSAIIGVLAIYIWVDYIFIQKSNLFRIIFGVNKLSSSISLTSDYNFYSLMFIISLFVLFYGLNKNFYKANNFLIQFSIWISVFNILLSTSRRGILVLAVFLIVGVFFLILSFLKNSLRKKLVFNLRYFCLSNST